MNDWIIFNWILRVDRECCCRRQSSAQLTLLWQRKLFRNIAAYECKENEGNGDVAKEIKSLQRNVFTPSVWVHVRYNYGDDEYLKKKSEIVYFVFDPRDRESGPLPFRKFSQDHLHLSSVICKDDQNVFKVTKLKRCSYRRFKIGFPH